MGNVFSTGNRYTFLGPAGQPVKYDFEYDKLKHSTGVAVQWLAPLGVFRFSYAIPLNAYKGDAFLYEDEVEKLPVLGRPGFLRGQFSRGVQCRFRFARFFWGPSRRRCWLSRLWPRSRSASSTTDDC